MALGLGGMAGAARAQPAALTLDASHPDMSVETGYLQAGGTNPAGQALGANSRYLTRDGRPWLPVMGEFHYVRYPRARWNEQLLKMKAGGITIVSTYIFWIYHEEEEGRFDWSGDRDLRAFVQLCAQDGLDVVVRIGPWDHGEVRNGGFPDWLLARCGDNVRKDAEPYLTYVRRLYGEIGRQLAGLLYKDGGPVIGVQLENELHDGVSHILTLKKLARAAGLDAPFYTETGWDGARIPDGGQVLPMFSGYPDGFWIDGLGWDRRGRKQYFFGLAHDDSVIGQDLKRTPGAQDPAYLAHYPYGACEIGSGMEPAYRRRPALDADDVAAEAISKLGSGSNIQGYYMYQGGANKLGKLSTLNETRATGYPNDLPEINYDYQAPLGEYGQRTPAYDALRLQHLFLADFGAELAPLPALMPDRRPASMDDHATLRWAVRSDGRRGFLFVNNYQHLDPLPEHSGVQFQVRLADGVRSLPSAPVTIPSGAYFIWPINLDLGGATLQYATAQPLCRLGDLTVFFAQPGIKPEFAFDPATLADPNSARVAGLEPGPGCLFTVRSRQGRANRVLVLTRQQAGQVWKANLWGADRLFLSADNMIFDSKGVLWTQSRRPRMSFGVYPAPKLGLPSAPEGIFTRFEISVPEHPVRVTWEKVRDAAQVAPVRVDDKGAAFAPADSTITADSGVWRVRVDPAALAGVHEVFLDVDYAGDIARAYLGDRFVDDDYYFGRTWEIGLSRFAPEVLAKGLTITVLPLRKDAPIYLPPGRTPDFGGRAQIGAIRGITAATLYEARVPAPTAP